MTRYLEVPLMQVHTTKGKGSKDPIKRLDAEIRKEIKQVNKTAAEKILEKMATPGKPITYPVQWDSPKQRRYVMWLLRSTNNLPYTRTDKHVKRWKIVNVRGGFSVVNTRKTTIYLSGNLKGKSQSRIHRGRWPLFADVIKATTRTLPKKIAAAIKQAVRKLGFRVKDG